MSQKLIRVQRLRELMAARGYTGVKEFAVALGRKSSQISDLLREVIPFGERLARSIEEAMQLPRGWLDGENADSSEILYGQTAIELVTIPYVKVIAKDGSPGFAVQPLEKPGMPVFFEQQWLDSRSYKAPALRATEVPDNSMAGRLYKGDTVVFNTELNKEADSKVFVLIYEEQTLIRRLVRDEGAWWMSCDNPDRVLWPRKKLTNDTIVVGQVISHISEHI